LIRTPEFAIAPSVIAAILARQWLGRRWLFFVFPVLAALVAGLFDLRMFIVAFILLLLVWPMALSFVWFSHALEPEAVRSSLPHVLEFDEYGINIVCTASDEHSVPQPERILWPDITSATQGRGHIIYKCTGGRHVVVPVSSLDISEWQHIYGWRTHRPS